MHIEIRYFDDCPNWQGARDLINAQLEALGLDAEIDLRRVESHEDAAELGFQGSPTIMIDGSDPFADPDAPVGLSCRVYWTDRGMSGLPTEDQLREALAG